ncbi:unnamed protein product [Brassica rapa subsp. trilocularis]
MTHPDEEYRQMKAWKRDTNMLGCVADAECGIPTRCPCGGTIINEVSRNLKYPTDFDTLPGRKYFTCKNYENDGFHFRQPWVFGVREEVEMLRKRVDAMAAEITELKYNLTRQNPTTP